MQRLNKSITHAVDRPVKVMQFGEGNFLRAFVDYIFDVTNEKTDFNGGVVIVKPIEFGTLDRFHDQECQYTSVKRFRERTAKGDYSSDYICS